LMMRLHVGSGAVKLQGDPTWRNCTALFYHYFTQPIPNFVSWYIHHLPKLIHVISVIAHFVVEFFAIVLMFVPNCQHIGFVLIFSLQTIIIVTGNYGSFNYLTIICSFTWLDDSHFPEFLRNSLNKKNTVQYDNSLVAWIQTLLAFVHFFFHNIYFAIFYVPIILFQQNTF